MMEGGSICPLDGRYRSSTNELRKVWGDCHLMRHRVYVELKWLEFFLNRIHPNGPLTDSQRQDLLPLYEFTELELEKIAAFEKQTNHDVKAVEYYLKERLSSVFSLKGFSDFLHILCTSEDINNLAYGLMIHQTLHEVLIPNMKQIAEELQRLAKQHADDALLARTHGQPATPTTFGKEFAVYAHRLTNHIQKITALKPLGKFSGAVGNFNAHLIAFPDKDWPALARDFVESLGLQYQPLSTQIECHDWISEVCDDLARFNTTLLGLCVDCWTYISRDLLVLKRVESEVGSSTMPHKVNPIDFENAEGNLGLANSMLRFYSSKLPISRLQRDLSDSTALRSLGCAFGYSLLGFKSFLKGINKTDVDSAAAGEELDRHWEVLAEPIQTVMRRAGEPGGYERMKELTRGRKVTSADLQKFILNLNISEKDKQRLLTLTPQTYVGLASQLANQ